MVPALFASRPYRDFSSFQELQVIYAHLAGIEALAKLRESALRSLCTMVRYERHAANDILFW